MTVGRSRLNRRRLLRGGLLAGIGAATVGSGLLLTPSAANAFPNTSQEGWRHCKNCQGLFFFNNSFTPLFGRCPAGTVHTAEGSFRYRLLRDIQEPWSEYQLPGLQFGWRHCKKCMGLSYIKNGVGRCPASDYHDHTGSHGYYLYHDVVITTPAAQDQWRWCDRCQGIFYGLAAPASRCPLGGPHRIGATSHNYIHPYE
jgi:hypothetical protein